MRMIVKREIARPVKKKTIAKIVKYCDICQRMKHLRGKRRGLIGSYEHATAPKAHLNIDVMGPIKERTKRKFIIVAVCSLSKYVWTQRTPRTPTTDDVLKFVRKTNNEYTNWPIRKITTDQGTIFQSRKWKKELRKENIK
jgi:hypothetical protein